MKALQFKSILFGLAFFGMAACNKNSDFLNYRNDAPAAKVNTVYNLKHLSGNPNVDVLWVIDNSGSMRKYQQSVIDNTAKFMDIFIKTKNLKWKMGLLSTDVRDEPYIGFRGSIFDYTVKDPTSVFQRAVRKLGIYGSGTEKSFAPVLNNLEKYPDFLRPGALLATIFVTDAAEQSDIPAQSYMDQLKVLAPNASKFLAYGVLCPLEECDAKDEIPYYKYKGSPYEIYISATGGRHYTISDPNFGTNLADLAKDLVSKITRARIYLDSRPNIASLKVLYKDLELPGGLEQDGGVWYYDNVNNAIVFYNLDFAPSDQEDVNVSYTEDNGLPIQN